MEKVVYKYELFISGSPDEDSIVMPIGTKILSVQLQRGILCIWCLVKPEITENEFRYFNLFATGEPIKQELSESLLTELIYINTIQYNNEEVYHLFEKTQKTQKTQIPK
jgi:hypothetical protein